MGVSYFLPRMIGSSAAAEHLLTGRPITAQEALTLGLFSRVGPLEEAKSAFLEKRRPVWRSR